MDRPIQNTADAFQKAPSGQPVFILRLVTIAIVIAGLAVSAVRRSWPEAGIFLALFVAFALFAIYSQRALRRARASIDQRSIDWFAAMPDVQRQHLNIEVRELSRVLEIEAGQIGDLQSAYIVAEDLALRQIQHEEGVPLLRHVSVAGVPFDAVYRTDSHVVCCEVAFLVAPELRQDRIEAMMRKISAVAGSLAADGISAGVRLMIILVTQLVPADEANLRSALTRRKFSETPVDIDIRLLDFEALQRIYVTDQVNF